MKVCEYGPTSQELSQAGSHLLSSAVVPLLGAPLPQFDTWGFYVSLHIHHLTHPQRFSKTKYPPVYKVAVPPLQCCPAGVQSLAGEGMSELWSEAGEVFPVSRAISS